MNTWVEFGCWFCRLKAWTRHRLGRCDSWCAYCITEAEELGSLHDAENPTNMDMMVKASQELDKEKT